EKPSLPYFRLPALESIDRNEPIVFNWPVGDSVYLAPDRSYTAYQVRTNPNAALEVGKNAKLITRPIDKKDHYIKRCIAIGGDSLQVKDRQVYINGVAAKNPKNLQFAYNIKTEGINWRRAQELGIKLPPTGSNTFLLTEAQVNILKEMDPKIEMQPIDLSYQRDLFPQDPAHFVGWNMDNYGPIYIPKKGATVQLSPETIALYRRVIDVYEGNQYKEENGQYIINGVPATSYTFKQDYFWAMGDNRHNSEDSRVWGFVPHDHIVGKPLFIWFSTKDGNMSNGINWNRLFTSAYKMD
ncbi:MAG TPA: S26 family signal peptidase, partial [Saprospiraceae bacterium]|nr:S26 family signal peptidase [Saprospiraceae bacterium]